MSIFVRVTFVMILTLLMKYRQEWSMFLNIFTIDLFFICSTIFASFDIFVSVYKVKRVTRHLCGRIKELYMSRKASLTCWKAKCGEYINVYKYCCFRFDASLKKVLVSCYYHALFVFLAVMAFKVNIVKIEYFWLIWFIHYFIISVRSLE